MPQPALVKIAMKLIISKVTCHVPMKKIIKWYYSITILIRNSIFLPNYLGNFTNI